MLTLSRPLITDFSAVRPDIQALQAELVRWRREIHQRPELGFQEEITAQFICDRLTEWDISYQRDIAKTGVVALIEGTLPGGGTGNQAPVLGIRADMDALPVQELNEVSYCSVHEGKMHACGHDGHVAIALGTAKYLQSHQDQFCGTVKIIFQPAEEGPGGAKPMIEAGVLSQPRSEEHTSELQSLTNLVCRLLLEKKKKTNKVYVSIVRTSCVS